MRSPGRGSSAPPPRRSPIGRRAALAALGAALGASCATPEPGGREGAAASGSSGRELPPVPRPAEVRATAVLADVQRVHDLSKGPYGLALLNGRSWAASAVVLAGLSVATADLVDASAPVRALLVKTPDGWTWLVAIGLRGADKLIASVSSGESARFRASRDDAARVDFLDLAPSEAPRSVFLAVARNHLVVAGTRSAISIAGAWVADPAADAFAKPTADLEASLDADAVAWLFGSLRGGAKALGPDFSPLIDLALLDDSVAKLGRAERATLSATVGEGAIAIEVAVSIPDGGGGTGADTCAEGKREELMRTSRDATIAEASFTSPAGRRAGAEAARTWLASSGLARGGPEVEAAFASLAGARGAATRIAIERSEMGWLAYGAVELADKKGALGALDALDKALSGEGSSGDPPPGAKPLGMRLSIEKTVIEEIGESYRARIARGEGKDAKTIATVLAHARGEALLLGAGTDPAQALARAVGPREGPPPPTLADRPDVGAVAAHVDASAGLFVFVGGAALSQKPRRSNEEKPGAMMLSVRSCASPWTIKAASDPAFVRALIASR